MITIVFFIILSTYYYIGNYLFVIPFTFLYLNYIKNTKINYLDNYIEKNNNYKGIICNKCKNILIKKYNFCFYEFILNNKFNNNQYFIFIIKIDNFLICIFNDFLLFILFYMKYLTKFIISNQFNLKKKFSPDNIENKKKNVLNLINNKYN